MKNIQKALNILENLGAGLHGPSYVGRQYFMNDEPYMSIEVGVTPLNQAIALLRKEVPNTEKYPCFATSSIATCISTRNAGLINLKELRDEGPCPHFDKCVELTETLRKTPAFIELMEAEE